MVSAVKDMQKGDQQARDQWVAYTDHHGGSTRDPAKHPADFLQGFITHYKSGARLPVSSINASDGVVETFKVTQRRSLAFKTLWSNYCVQYGRGLMDPSKHDVEFCSYFLENVAEQALTQGGANGMMMAGGGGVPGVPAGVPGMPGGCGGCDPNMAKRMKMDDMVALQSAGVDERKARVVAQLKAYQRLGNQQCDLWCLYADTYLGGLRDPMAHETNTLEEFCVNHQVPSMDQCQALLASAGGPGGMQNQFMDPEKEAVIARVKNFQKLSRDNAALWLAFCGRTRDPTRHEVSKLHEFCQLYNIP